MMMALGAVATTIMVSCERRSTGDDNDYDDDDMSCERRSTGGDDDDDDERAASPV